MTRARPIVRLSPAHRRIALARAATLSRQALLDQRAAARFCAVNQGCAECRRDAKIYDRALQVQLTKTRL